MAAATRQREPFLSAGALLPVDADADAPLDPVRARRYHHRALGGRTVVRLAGETVAVAEDRLLALLGFDQAEVGEPLGRTLRRGLGYAEWVLVNDLDRADTALAVAPVLEGAARLVPLPAAGGHPAVRGVASRLPTTHLPALWEHAGRAFLAGAGRNRWRWAAAMFERAREAERVHGLRVDQTLRRAFGSRPYRNQGAVDSISGATAADGLTVAVARYQRSMWLFFRPALLGEQDTRSRCLRHWLTLDQLDKARAVVSAIDLLRGRGHAAMAERIGSTPVPEGGYEADPASSAPGTVRAVQQALGLGADAAALYLQLLTLLEPTDRNVHRWNGRTAARRRRAGAELAGAGLVVEATRPRAGRHLFLPGEWVPAAAPDRSLEAWKLPLYRIKRDPAGASPRGPLPRFFRLAPLHELFAATWGRVQAGDHPGQHSQGGTA